MSGIFGALGISDGDRVFVNTIGQDVVYDAIQELLDEWNADLNAALAVFVERTTDDFKLRYKLPGGGRLQQVSGMAEVAEVARYGQWDVAFPLKMFAAGFGGDRVSLAYLTAVELDAHLDTIFAQDLATVRYELLKTILNNAPASFLDVLHGSLTLVPIANGDGVIYPPILGAEVEAVENHFLLSGYISSGISDTNNPFPTIVDELEEHFGAPTGGSSIVTFIANAQKAKVEALTDFEEVGDRFIRPGDDTAIPIGLPTRLPGKILGRCSGSWVVEWRWVPDDYVIGIHMDAPKPVIRRIDPADTGLSGELNLVQTDEKYPLKKSTWDRRFGLGVGNRLNGVVMQMKVSAPYVIPTGYS